jgi:hypothetical protein
MNPRLRKGSWKFVRFFAVLGIALLVSPVGKAYAQVHGFSSGSFGHLGRGSRSFHGSVGSNWSPAWGQGRFGHAPYSGLYSSGPRFYGYPLHPYPLHVYPGGNRPRYYVPQYHGPRYYGGQHSLYYYRHH